MNCSSCNKCNWVHFTVTAEYIDQWQKDWVVFWNKSTPEIRASYGCMAGPPGPEQYLECFRCGNSYTDFKDTSDSDIPHGSTIQPILHRDETI